MRGKQATSEFLKECMADALLQLLKEKPMEEITVTEITSRANVGRVTFYRNFTKKEDLIIYKLTVLGKQFGQNHPFRERNDVRYAAQQLFTFVYSIREILLTLHHANLLGTVLIPLYEATRQKNPDDHAWLFQNSFLSFGLIGITLEWIQDGFQETPEELLEIMASFPADIPSYKYSYPHPL